MRGEPRAPGPIGADIGSWCIGKKELFPAAAFNAVEAAADICGDMFDMY